MREIKDIVVHCSATKTGQNVTVEQIDQWHKQRGFKKIGYHYVIYLDGSIHKGRDISEVGAHVSGHNSNSIGVCYIGGLGTSGKPADTRTEKQKIALLSPLHKLKEQFPNAKISGHRDFSPDLDGDGEVGPHELIKSCPCFNAKEEYKNL